MQKADETRNDLYRIKAVSFQNKKDNKVYSVYCTGELNVTSEIRQITKTCSGIVMDSETRVTGVTLSLTAYASEEFRRAFFGQTNDGLKEGVYAYKASSVGDTFTLVVLAEDKMEGKETLLAFPKVKNTNGYAIRINNDDEEVQKIQFDANALIAEGDDAFLYEYTLKDDEENKGTLIEGWLTEFTKEKVNIGA